jgi:hypothetical protein
MTPGPVDHSHWTYGGAKAYSIALDVTARKETRASILLLEIPVRLQITTSAVKPTRSLCWPEQ